MNDTAWAALAEPRRRAILDVLVGEEATVGELVTRLGLSQPQASKHLRVLREAGLVRVRKDAQRRVYDVEPRPLAELDDWLTPYRRRWNERLDRLGRRLDETREDHR